MKNRKSFLVLVNTTMNEAVLNYFEDEHETVTHYTSPNGFLNIIQGKELWFGNIDNVNDTTEINYAIREIIRPCINGYNFLNKSLKQRINCLLPEIEKLKFSFVDGDEIKFKKASIFVFSTSIKNNSTLLWELYCKNSESKGYAITFDKTKFIGNLYDYNIKKQDENIKPTSSDKSATHYLLRGKVIYKREKQIEIINNYLSLLEYAIEQQDSESMIQAIIDIYVQKFLILALFMKDEDFDKEDEYRFAVICDDEFIDTNKANSPYLVFGSNGGNIVSRLAIPFGGELIKSITLSPFISDVKAIETTKYFLDKNEMSNIEIIHNSPKIRK